MTITSFTLGSTPDQPLAIEAVLFDIEARHSADRGVHVSGLSEVQRKEMSVRVQCAMESIGERTVGVQVTLGRGALAGYSVTPTRAMAPALDLPIAFALLHGASSFPDDLGLGLALAGELGIDGAVRPIRGVFAFVQAARAADIRGVVVPMQNANEAYEAAGGVVDVYAVRQLADLRDLRKLGDHHITNVIQNIAERFASDFRDVRGHAGAIAQLATAVAERQDAILVGPPGTGKLMLAARIPSIMRPLPRAHADHLTKIYSALGMTRDTLITARPVRAPHCSISSAALLGAAAIDAGLAFDLRHTGGSPSLAGRPGEIHLASYGVLVLDEIADFTQAAQRGLRHILQQMGDARPIVVATGDPGFGPGRSAALERALATIGITGTRIAVEHVPLADLRTAPAGETSADIRARLWGAP